MKALAALVLCAMAFGGAYAAAEAPPAAAPTAAQAPDPNAERETAALDEAKALRKSDPARAKALLRDVLDTTTNRDRANAAWQALRLLGENRNPARERGYLTHYWLIGPFASWELDEVWPPEQAYLGGNSWNGDLPAPWTKQTHPAKGGAQAAWREAMISDAFGVVDLLQRVSPEYYVLAYGVSVVYVPEEQGAVLRLGSDDGITVWLNGEEIHTNPAVRQFQVDEDSVPIRLKAGRNEFFFKIGNGERLWLFAARLLNSNGKPLEFEHGTAAE